MKNNPIFLYSFGLVTILFVVAVIIYGFDINYEGKSRKAVANLIKNSGKEHYYYKFDDKYAFAVFDVDEPEYTYLGFSAYTRNYVPFCFFCGYYVGDPNDDNFIYRPALFNEYLYSSYNYQEYQEGKFDGQFEVFDMETATFSKMDDLSEIGITESNKGKLLNHDFVLKNYKEISYNGPDDEDCMITFGALTLAYIILFVWFVIIMLSRLFRRT